MKVDVHLHFWKYSPDDRSLLRPAFCRGLAALAGFDLTYGILIYPRHLPVAAELAERFPAQTFLLDHLAKPPVKAGGTGEWERAAGSDWPVCTLAADYGRVISLVDEDVARRPAHERRAVMGGNAARLWRLPAGELV